MYTYLGILLLKFFPFSPKLYFVLFFIGQFPLTTVMLIPIFLKKSKNKNLLICFSASCYSFLNFLSAHFAKNLFLLCIPLPLNCSAHLHINKSNDQVSTLISLDLLAAFATICHSLLYFVCPSLRFHNFTFS